jgi:aminopeptidase N
LFALVGGDLKYVEDIYFTKSGRRVTLRIYVEPEHLDQCDHAMESLKQAMRWDEERFGLEYDLDIYMIVAVQDFNMGAMENKGLNIFNAKYVLSRVDTATDADFENIESIVAHEYFHNYTGNRVTCRDWFQLSLKEGLTVFRDQEFTSDLRSRPVKRIQDVRFLRDYQFPEDASPTAHPVRPDSYLEINNFYTATVYEKGSEVIRMLQTVLGRDGFTKGVQSYLSQHDGSAATIEDFVAALEAANETDLSAFMRWYEQAGTPVVRARDAYDAARQRYELRLQQRYPAELAGDVVPIPIQLGLLSAEGAPIAFALQGQTATDHTFVMKSREETLTFEGIPSRPVPSLLRQFSAPVRLDYDFTTEQLALLYRHDTDAFNRWEAGQRLSTQIILDGMTRPPEVTTLVEGMRGILSEEHADLRFLTQLLSLPLEGFLTEQMSPIAPAKLRESLWGLERRLASDLRDLWRENYQRYHDGASADLSAEAAGRRAFKNFCLRRLGWLDEAEVRELALRQFQESRNMTDAMGALEVLTHSDGEERLEALDAFYARWQDDALVLDKWFRLQAVARRDKVLEEVHGLLQHPKFTYRTPNRVRSLVGAYAQGNFFQFHRPDGAGYRFLVDQILHLNAQNPQVAARLLTPLTRWSRFEPQPRQLMQLELQRLSKSANLSRDVYEIVSKSLKVSA